MDAHFNEYLAAVAGMQDLYGHAAEDHPTEFHDDVTPPAVAAEPVAPAATIATLAQPRREKARSVWREDRRLPVRLVASIASQ